MANELAAIANTPNGATMTVVIICAPQITACSNAKGVLIRNASQSTSLRGAKLPFSPVNFNSGDFLHKNHIITTATTTSANPVPKAAPTTPNPAPGIFTGEPKIWISLVGNIKK